VSDIESQLWVNTLFRGRQLAEFLAVKNHLGLQSNAEVIRHLIHKQARVLRRRPRARVTPAHPAPAGPKDATKTEPPDVRSLCLSCPLPDCDETDAGCLYQQATGQREAKRERMRAYVRHAREAPQKARS
jgi:hypothetical protein